MTYKIDRQLPWFPAQPVLKDDMYVNTISKLYADKFNPNGLFSGFLSKGVFHTSRWNGYQFVATEIPVGDLDEVLFLEFLDKPKKEEKDFRKKAQEKVENPFWKTQPKTNPDYTKIYKSLEEAFKEAPKITLGDSPELVRLFSGLFSTDLNPKNPPKSR